MIWLGVMYQSDIRNNLIKIKLTQRECDQLLRSANVQPNGYVKYEEFVKMITMPLPEY